ncbi:MAG: alkaline phosphatase family protein [Anaerolineae bacterium]|nr:alkaline phosphatase family protein [Anaerolineae bacterium]MDX9828755.1 alkaline phosphatase family protein [Anaerolineae bacterium]
MSFLDKLRGRKRERRVVFIGLDGMPYTFMQRLIAEGRAPNAERLARQGSLLRMDSTWPWVSSVAWSSMMTGVNPAKHNIFGFIDRDPATYKQFIPTSQNMRARTLWEVLSDAGKRVIVVNVPVTYPPRPVNGVLVGCFLSPSLEKAVYPPSYLPTLQSLGYIVDADPWKARESKDLALQEVNSVLDARIRTLFHMLDHEQWDYLHVHVMETDRLHHFLWQQMEEGHATYAPAFYDFYRRIDDMLGELAGRLDENTTLVWMADHGFCTIKKEVYVNRWLMDNGWLHLRNVPPDRKKGLDEIDPRSVAYSLDPGRVFIRVQGREKEGSVPPGAAYEGLRDEIAAAALELTDPDSGERIFQAAFRREELYHGPYLEQAADLILAPYDGYDPKGPLYKEDLTFKGDELVGMHTHDDAMLYVGGQTIPQSRFSVLDVMPTLLDLMGVSPPPGLDGKSLL